MHHLISKDGIYARCIFSQQYVVAHKISIRAQVRSSGGGEEEVRGPYDTIFQNQLI